VSGALGLEQALEHGDRMRRGHADRLVEDHPAMNVALVAPRLVVWPRLFALTGILTWILARIVVAVARVVDARLIGKIFFETSCDSAFSEPIALSAVVTIIIRRPNRVRGPLCTAGVSQ